MKADKLQMTINRDVAKNEFKWLRQSYKKGQTVFLYTGYTYECMGDGLPCSLTGMVPSFELPGLLLSVNHDGKEHSIFQTETVGAIFEMYARSADDSTIKITAFRKRFRIEIIQPEQIPSPF